MLIVVNIIGAILGLLSVYSKLGTMFAIGLSTIGSIILFIKEYSRRNKKFSGYGRYLIVASSAAFWIPIYLLVLIKELPSDAILINFLSVIIIAGMIGLTVSIFVKLS